MEQLRVENESFGGRGDRHLLTINIYDFPKGEKEPVPLPQKWQFT
jgi:hypothetical protein